MRPAERRLQRRSSGLENPGIEQAGGIERVLDAGMHREGLRRPGEAQPTCLRAADPLLGGNLAPEIGHEAQDGLIDPFVARRRADDVDV